MRRQDLVNAAIQAGRATSFLQIGSARHFDEVECPVKRSHHFEALDEIPAGARYDVVFVDPPHDAGRAAFALQVALEHVHPAGVVLVGNVNPAEEWMQEVPASRPVQLGQVWRAWVDFRATSGRPTFTVSADHGIGVVLPGAVPIQPARPVSWAGFDVRRGELLGLVDWDEGVRALRAVYAPPAEPPVPAEPSAASEPAPAPRRRRRDR